MYSIKAIYIVVNLCLTTDDFTKLSTEGGNCYHALGYNISKCHKLCKLHYAKLVSDFVNRFSRSFNEIALPTFKS